MTTSVVYGSSLRYVNLAQNENGVTAGATVSTISSNIGTMLDTGVTLVQQVNNSATGTNPNATFTNTPTNGNAMIAVLARGGDNAASTAPAGWTQLTAQGSAGTRRLEIFWKRAGASEAKLHTWTNATSGLWDLILIEFGGWAAVADPTTIIAGANVTTTTSTTFNQTGILESVCAVVTSGGSVGTFTNTGTNTESVTNLPFTTTTRFRAMSVDAWTNRPKDQTNQISWTTSRPFTRAQVGWANGTEVYSGTYGPEVGNGTSTSDLLAAQMGMTFQTGSVPDGDTVTSATISLKAGPTVGTWPANCGLNVYSLAGTAIAASNSNTRTVWKKPTEIQALTRVATRAAGSAWTAGTVYDWTSDATFPAQINKTGDTTLLIATGDQQTGTTRATSEYANFDPTVTLHYITIIHNFQGAATVAATLIATPTITRIASFPRSVATSLTATPVIARTVAYLRSITSSVTSTPAITASVAYLRTITTALTVTPAITRTVSIAKTITASLTATGSIVATKITFVAQVARVIRLGGRTTIQIAQTVTARLGGRTTIRAPKE